MIAVRSEGVKIMSKNAGPNKQSQGVISVRRGVAVLFAVALVAGTALATVALSRLVAGGSVVSPGGANSSVPAVRASEGTSQAPEASVHQAAEDELLLELSTDGFTPAEATHPAGAFAISVDNRNVEGEYVLQLKGGGGTLLNEVRVQKGSAGWTVDLPAGTYTLMVANHPDWVCQITTQ